jgi:uncharacterized membrane protein
MYCNECGAAVSDEAKFCSGCGRTIDTTQVAKKPLRSMETHVNILAWLFIGSAILYAMFGLVLLIAPRILQELPIPTPPEVSFDIVNLVTAVSGILAMVILGVAAGTAAAGIGLLQYQTWGRTLALVMSAINLIKLPFGTALGIYGFWVLLSERGRVFYERQSAIAEGRTATQA